MKYALQVFLYALLCSLTPVEAAPLTADEFEAAVTGHTVNWWRSGKPCGREVFHPGRRVTWAFEGGTCETGAWFADGPGICFLYDDSSDPVCWLVEAGPQGLMATLVADPLCPPLIQAVKDTRPLVCGGAGV